MSQFSPWSVPSVSYNSSDTAPSSLSSHIKFADFIHSLYKYTFTIYLLLHFRLFVVVQLLSRVQLFGSPRTEARQASLSLTISQSLPKFMSIESVMPSNHLTFCWSLLLLPSLFPSNGSFPMSQQFTSGSQNIGASASTGDRVENKTVALPSGNLQ